MKKLNLKVFGTLILLFSLTIASAYTQTKYFVDPGDKFKVEDIPVGNVSLLKVITPEEISKIDTESTNTTTDFTFKVDSDADQGVYSFSIIEKGGSEIDLAKNIYVATVMVGFNPKDYYTESKVDNLLSNLKSGLRDWAEDKFAEPSEVEEFRSELEDQIEDIKENYVKESVCGNWICEANETWFDCPEDCPKPECPTCPEPTEWSACINGTQNRTVYLCNETTNFTCQGFNETEECKPIFGPAAVLVTAFTSWYGILGLIIVFFVIFLWKGRKIIKLIKRKKLF